MAFYWVRFLCFQNEDVVTYINSRNGVIEVFEVDNQTFSNNEHCKGRIQFREERQRKTSYDGTLRTLKIQGSDKPVVLRVKSEKNATIRWQITGLFGRFVVLGFENLPRESNELPNPLVVPELLGGSTNSSQTWLEKILVDAALRVETVL